LRRLISSRGSGGLLMAEGQVDGQMSRTSSSGFSANRAADQAADAPAIGDSAKIAEDIGIAALVLAQRAHEAGLPTLGYLLESIALEAGAEAAATQFPTGTAGI
jgi:hypothetical protein